MNQLLPIQTQPFFLYGNGCVIGNTSVVLTSFNDIDGNPISFQGTIMTGTIEPGSGSNEEQIVFTGLTRNSNGTVTLTGVSSVTFASPYTQTSGVLKSHFGNTTFTLSDTAFLYSQYASLGANNTFTGTDTFTVSPIIPTVSSSQTNQAASVGYVNSVALSGSPKASNTVFGIVELTVAPVTASVPLAVGDNDPRMNYVTASESLALAGDGGTPSNLNTYVTQQGVQNGSENYALTSGSSTAYTISYSPTPSGYVIGELIKFKTHVASGTAPTINKNSLGAKNIYKNTSSGTTGLAVADFSTNQMNVAEYDGAAYQLISPISNLVNSAYTTGFGVWGGATIDGAGHQVTTDGFLVLSASGNTISTLTIKSDSASTPTTIRASGGNTSAGGQVFVMCPIRKNDYYLVSVSGSPSATNYSFIPIS